MKIVSVGAPGNDSGKTLTVSTILRAFPGRLHAVKFTTVFKDGVNCPKTERACACRTLHGAFTIVTDPRTLEMEQTDTGRLTRAGARSVLWCLAMQGRHEDAWAHLRSDLLVETDAIITEGNSIVPFLDPDLLIMVVHPGLARERWKPDTWDLIHRADRVIVNDYNCTEEAVHLVSEEIALKREGRLPSIEDVALPLNSWRDSWIGDAISRVLGEGSGRAL